MDALIEEKLDQICGIDARRILRIKPHNYVAPPVIGKILLHRSRLDPTTRQTRHCLESLGEEWTT